MTRHITAAALKARIESRQEFAILDVREQGIYFQSHLLWATNMPLSRLEFMVAKLLPRKNAPVTVCDGGPADGETVATTAAHRLAEIGYSQVTVLKGGTAGWAAAGFELFSGLNVPSKTFGEFLLQQRKPPEVEASRLHRRLDAGENLAVFDARPMDEYSAMSIPGAIDVPGAELVYRVFAAVPDPATDIIVNCAGRTRSIVGAMSLINAEIPNRVALLKDGTMGWQLAGLPLDHGKSAGAPAPQDASLALAKRAAQRVKKRFGVEHISSEQLNLWRRDLNRTLYIFDVRTRQEYLDRHVHGSIHAPGGQLVQTTDEFIAVRNSTIVLVDDHDVRAVMTASWLQQMGEPNVYVLQDPFESEVIETGVAPQKVARWAAQPTISAGELHAVIQSGEPTLLVDFSSSRTYRRRHIPQAYWCIRQHLMSALHFHRPIGLLVLTSASGRTAHLAAMDYAQAEPNQLLRVLEGGNDAWEQAGYPLIGGTDNLLCKIDDVWDRPYDREHDQDRRMRQYLEWEQQLMDQAERDGTTRFRC